MTMLNRKTGYRRISKLIVLCCFIGLIAACNKSEEPEPTAPEQALEAHTIVEAMDAGFNLGNTFDLNINSTRPDDIYPIIDFYANAGMKHIRIPTTWMDGFDGNTLASSSGNIDFSHPRFIQLKAVIDYALDKDLYVVLNAHHERWLYSGYDGTATYTAPFQNLWSQIARHFKDYPQELIFEVLNEPQGNFGEFGGAVEPTDNLGLTRTREINALGYNAIRNAGGPNDVRIVMIGMNGWGNHSLLDDVYPTKSQLPGNGDDPYLVAHLHTYDPWEFCGQNGSNDAFPGAAVIASSINSALDHADMLGIPVSYGEFGVGRETNNSSRDADEVRDFYKTIRSTTAARGMSSTCWDDQGWFGLISKAGIGQYSFLYNIVPNMLRD